MNRVLIHLSLLLSASVGVGTLFAQEATALKLDLTGHEIGAVGAGTKSTALPLTFPSKVTATEPNSVSIEENFSNGSETLNGRALVLRRLSDDGRCGVDFVFPDGALTSQGVITLDAELLFEGDQQRGNVVLVFRGPKNAIVFYLQIGVGGGLTATASEASDATATLGTLPVGTAPVNLKITLDYTKHEAAVFVDEQAVGEPLSLVDLPVTVFSTGVYGPAAKRTFAVQSLTISQK